VALLYPALTATCSDFFFQIMNVVSMKVRLEEYATHETVEILGLFI
jgi:hypothetical protein